MRARSQRNEKPETGSGEPVPGFRPARSSVIATRPVLLLIAIAITAVLTTAVCINALHHGPVLSVAAWIAMIITLAWAARAVLASRREAIKAETQAQRSNGFQVSLLTAILRTLDLRDRMTARHSAAVARYSRELAAAAGMSEQEQEIAHTAGLLHDIGKFILPDHILKGNTELTEADWAEIRRHPYEGARIVSQVDHYQPVAEIILSHHERIDGLGYPRGLSGDEIPEIAKLIAVVDCYDAMTARDSYRRPIDARLAIEELRRVSGTQLDPKYVELFIEMLGNRELNYRHGQSADLESALAISGHSRVASE